MDNCPLWTIVISFGRLVSSTRLTSLVQLRYPFLLTFPIHLRKKGKSNNMQVARGSVQIKRFSSYLNVTSLFHELKHQGLVVNRGWIPAQVFFFKNIIKEKSLGCLFENGLGYSVINITRRSTLTKILQTGVALEDLKMFTFQLRRLSGFKF